MKTSQELQQEVYDLQKLTDDLKRQLEAALSANVEMKKEVSMLRQSTN